MEINIVINGVKTDLQTVREHPTLEHGELTADAGSAGAIQSNGYSQTIDDNPSMVDIGAPPDWLVEGIKNSSSGLIADTQDENLEDAGSGPTE